MTLPKKPKLKSLAEQGYVQPRVKKVVVNEPPTETSPYYMIPGKEYRKAWLVNQPTYQAAQYLDGQFGNQPQHSEGWDKLSPMEQRTTEYISGSPAVKWATENLQKLSDNPWIGPIFAALQKPVQWVERSMGYAYQAAFDPALRGVDAIGVTLFGKADDYLNSTDPQRRKMGAAWKAATAFFETSDIAAAGRDRALAGIYLAANLPKLMKEALQNAPAIIGAGVLGTNEAPPMPEHERVLRDIASPEFFKWYAETGTPERVIQSDAEITAGLKAAGWSDADIAKALEVARTNGDSRAMVRLVAGEGALSEIPADAWSAWFQATSNLQRIWQEDFVKGTATPTGGLPELIEMRRKLMAGQPYDTVYQEYMQSLNALAYRAQMSDLLGQVEFDPLNLVPLLKPKDWLHGMRATILHARIAPEIMNAASDVRNAARIATEVVQAGEEVAEAVRVGQATDAANAFIKAARDLHLDDFTRVADEVESLVKMGASPEDIAKVIGRVDPLLAELDKMKEMSRVERVILAVTGGDPFNPTFGKIRVGAHEYVPFRSRLNPFALSAAGRADEFLNTVYHSVQIIMKEAGADPVQIVDMLKRAASGVFGGRFGHVVISPIGRHVQNVLREMDAHLTDLLVMWTDTTKERSLATAIARAIGSDIVEVVEVGRKGMPEATSIFDRLVAASLKPVEGDAVLTELYAMVAKGDIKAEQIYQLGKLFESTPTKIVPYTAELFRASVIQNMSATIVDMAKKSFGLKEARWIEKAVVPIKAVESLVLLGLNPMYPIRNFFNNEVTMMVRGVGSSLLPRSLTRRIPGMGVVALEDVMDSFGIDVARLHEGFGIQGSDLLAELARGEARPEEFGVIAGREALRKTVWGTPKGISAKIINSVREIKDFRKVAAAFERLSSERAMTVGMVRAWGWIWPRTMTQLEDYMPGLGSRLDDFATGYADFVTQAARSARKPEDIAELLTSKNIRLNLETVLARTAAEMGISPEQVAKMIPEETIEAVRGILRELGTDATPQKVEEAFAFLRSKAQEHIDDLVASHMEDIAAEAIAKIESEGQVGVVQVWGELTDRTTRRHYAHMERLDDAWERIYKIEDPTLRSRMVKRLVEETEQTWARHWKYERALRDGMVKGFAARGTDLSAAWLKGYDDLNDANRAYFKLRNELWSSWWENTPNKSYDDLLLAQVTINEKLDAEYVKLIDLTDAQHAKMDEALLGALFTKDTPMTGLTRMWRDGVRAMRRRYMEDVLDFRKSIRGLPDAQKQAAWIGFHAENRRAFMEIRTMERAGMDMLNGDATAADIFRMKLKMEGVEPGQILETQRNILSGGLTGTGGATLTDEQKVIRDYLVRSSPLSPDRRRLQEVFGNTFSQEIIDQYAKRWTSKPVVYGGSPEIHVYDYDLANSAAYTLEGPAGGTQGAMWYRNNTTGTRFIVKASDDMNRVATEALANKIYQQLGILTPETGRVHVGNQWATSAREVKGQWFPSIVNDAQLRGGFVADAYLGNWDVMGATFDNIIWDEGGHPWRVDQGGTMFYRAQGAPKEFGAKVTELDSLLDASKNPIAAAAYGTVSEAEKREQALTLVMRMSDQWIDDAVKSAGFEKDAGKAVAAALKERRNWLADRFDLKIPKPPKVVGVVKGGPQNIHEFLRLWVNEDGTWKEKMIAFLEANPGAGQEVQDLAQWWLYENGFSSLPLYTGKLRVYRSKSVDLSSLHLKPWDSMTPRFDIAKAAHPGYPVIEFEIPAENIFAHQQSHPAFEQFAKESEFILNERGYEGARVISVNGHPPTESEIDALKAMNPQIEFGATLTDVGKPSIDFDSVVGRERYDGLIEDDMLFEGTGVALDNMEQAAIKNLREPPTVLDSLPADLKTDLTHYLDHVTGDLNDARLGSVRMAEALRDSALLNYNARYNFDNWLAVAMPFEFWWTHSMMQWAASAIERPAWLSQYARIRDFLHNAQADHRGFPSRLRGRVRIPLPFAPREMGDAWVDPFSAFGFPLEQFVRPFERWKTSTVSQEQRTVKKLDELRRGGDISDTEYTEATTSMSGVVWDRARSLVLEDDKGLQYDLMDFMNLSVSPHLPISIAANIARGRPEEIGVLPHTRTLRNVGVLLGMEPGVYDNVWGNIRKAIGLPAFDQWDDYRVDRQFGNMLGDNKLTPEEAIRAMVERDGEVFDEARRQSAKTEAVQWGYSLLGLPVNFYPPGEEHLREITPLFFDAMDQDDKGNPYPLRTFFEKYPEYEVRLALWKKPEERAKQFMADWIYDKYYGMTDLNKSEVRDALGDQFVQVMLDKETRNPQSASVNVLGMWMRMMGGDAPGEIATDALPIPLTRPDIAQRLQVWYDYRDRIFPGVYDLQHDYFQLDEGTARREFRNEHPMLPIYWAQRRDFMSRNPELAPYIEEDPAKLPTYPSEEALREVEATEPNYSWDEWTNLVSFPVGRLVLDYVDDGSPLPASAIDRLEQTATALGLEGGYRAVLDRMTVVAPDLTGQ
jgi:hypothetical protein